MGSGKGKNDSILTSVLTRSPKSKKSGRFQRVGHGLFRFKKSGVLYGVFKQHGRTHWKSLGTDEVGLARQLLAKEIANTAKIAWRKSAGMTLRGLIALHQQNPMGLAASTLKIRSQLLNVFQRTWPHGLDMKVSEVKGIMLKLWLVERRQQRKMRASGVNNYIRMFQGLFKIAVEAEAIVESPVRSVELLKEENPERLTPTWEQAQQIIQTVSGATGKRILSAMLYLGLGQAELANLKGEHISFEKNEVMVRRQKTQKVFTIPIYPQARPLLEELRANHLIAPNKSVFERSDPREALTLACKKLGYPMFTPRSFRRAFIVRALERNIDPRVVAAWQGHQDATLVLKVYGHIIRRSHSDSMALLMN